MSYEPNNWEDYPSELTPISASRLTHMETQYQEALSTFAESATYVASSGTDGVLVLSGNGSISVDVNNPSILIVHEAEGLTTASVPKLDGGNKLDVNVVPVRANTTATRPASPPVGTSTFDTTLGRPIWYKGPGWVDATGASV